MIYFGAESAKIAVIVRSKLMGLLNIQSLIVLGLLMRKIFAKNVRQLKTYVNNVNIL